MRIGLILLFSMTVLLAACEPAATPFPVDIPPAPTATPSPGPPLPIRYALDANTHALVADLDLIAASAQVEQLTGPVVPDELGTRYDLVSAYGEWAGWTRSPVLPHVALVINANITPLNNSSVRNIVRQSLDLQEIVNALNIPGVIADQAENAPPDTLRTQLANMGLPDGIELTFAYAYTPGALQVGQQLRTANIINQPILMKETDIRAAFDAQWLHLALIDWATPEQRENWTALMGDDNVIDLYAVPISYLALPELTIVFSPGGWPLAQR